MATDDDEMMSQEEEAIENLKANTIAQGMYIGCLGQRMDTAAAAMVEAIHMIAQNGDERLKDWIADHLEGLARHLRYECGRDPDDPPADAMREDVPGHHLH